MATFIFADQDSRSQRLHELVHVVFLWFVVVLANGEIIGVTSAAGTQETFAACECGAKIRHSPRGQRTYEQDGAVIMRIMSARTDESHAMWTSISLSLPGLTILFEELGVSRSEALARPEDMV